MIEGCARETGHFPQPSGWTKESNMDIGYQTVVCVDCTNEYTCTPLSDYYNFTTDRDGVCFDCLLARHDLEAAE